MLEPRILFIHACTWVGRGGGEKKARTKTRTKSKGVMMAQFCKAQTWRDMILFAE